MKRNLVCLLLICVVRMVLAETANEDGLYDGSEIDFDLSDMEDDPFDSVSDIDETRHFMGPARRRRRLRKLQGMANELKSLSHCWQMHNQCSHMIPHETRYGLTNADIRWVWHCNCSMEFFKCLHRIDTFLSKQTGDLYFSANSRCYRNDYKIVKCLEYDVDEYSRDNKRCIHNLLDVSYSTELQWFDLPFYSGKAPKEALYITTK